MRRKMLAIAALSVLSAATMSSGAMATKRAAFQKPRIVPLTHFRVGDWRYAESPRGYYYYGRPGGYLPGIYGTAWTWPWPYDACGGWPYYYAYCYHR
jgi:hypothetical protein